MDSCNESCLKSTGWKLRKRHLDGFPTFLQNRPACWILGDPKFWTLLGGDCWWWWQCRSKNDAKEKAVDDGNGIACSIQRIMIIAECHYHWLFARAITDHDQTAVYTTSFLLDWHRVPNMDWSVPSASERRSDCLRDPWNYNSHWTWFPASFLCSLSSNQPIQ